MEKVISVGKWGHGLGVRLPKRFLDENRIDEKSKVLVNFERNRLVLTPMPSARTDKPSRTLKEIAYSNGWNGQPLEPEETDWGGFVGEEENW